MAFVVRREPHSGAMKTYLFVCTAVTFYRLQEIFRNLCGLFPCIQVAGLQNRFFAKKQIQAGCHLPFPADKCMASSCAAAGPKNRLGAVAARLRQISNRRQGLFNHMPLFFKRNKLLNRQLVVIFFFFYPDYQTETSRLLQLADHSLCRFLIY